MFVQHTKMARCKTFGKAGLPVPSNVEGLIEACNLIDQMKIAERNQDLRQGDTSTLPKVAVQVCMSICWATCSLPPALRFGDLRRGAADSSVRRGILSA